MKITGGIAATCLLTLVASGCGSKGEERSDSSPGSSATTQPPLASSSGPRQDGPGTYELVSDAGALVDVRVPVASTSPVVKPIEQLRHQVQAPALTYFVADVDNTGGTTDLYSDYIIVITQAGKTVKVPYIGAGDGSPLDSKAFGEDKAYDVYNGYLNKEQVRAGARQRLIFATFDKVPTVGRVLMPTEELGEELRLYRVDNVT